MGWVEGVVAVLTGLAWPLVVLIAILVLKREIGKLITRLTRFSGAGVEAEFSQQVEKASDIAEALAPNVPQQLPPVPGGAEGTQLTPEPTLSDLMAEADAHPVGAMVRAWNLVEARAAEVMPGAANPANTRMILKNLLQHERISYDLYQLGRRLADLRNRVVHGNVTPTTDDAKEFVEATWRLASELSRTDPLTP